MATQVKPTRLKITGTPSAGQVPMYVDANNFQWGSAGSSGYGRFLSLRNCSTGQPISFPEATPYAYTTGDYFMVSVVSSATPPVNYRPNGSSYTGTASSTTESDEVLAGDVYVYDGSVWLLQSNNEKTVSFANIAGQPTDNLNLAADLSAKQDTLTAGTGIDITSNVIKTTFNYGESTSAAADTTKTVSIPAITTLNAGQTIIVKTINTNTAGDTSLQLNNFTAYQIRYNGAALTSTTDSYVWGANMYTLFMFDGSHWEVISKSYDLNTTYTQNTLLDAGKYVAGTGTYALSRYSLVMEKDNGTWEKITNTSASYTTATTKTVNTNGFRLNHIRYYNTTTNVATGALIATNTLANQTASVDLRYSTNCGGTTTWAEGDYIYLVGTMGVDGLFYLDTTTWWTNALPTTNDGKLYIRIGISLAAAGYTASLLVDRPIYYYDNGIKLYIQADNKQDNLSAGSGISISSNTVSNTGVLSVNGNTGAVTGLQSQHTSTTATLSSASWTSHTQTVSVTGVTASNTVLVSPAPSSFADYTNAMIYCSAQASGTLTFSCTTDPTSNITVNIIILD